MLRRKEKKMGSSKSVHGLSKSLRITIIMGSLLIIAVVLSLQFFSANSETHNRKLIQRHPESSISPEINLACQASQFPDLCKSSLMKSRVATKHAGPQEIIDAAMEISSDGAKQSYRLSQSILANSKGNLNRTAAAKDCLEFLDGSIRWIAQSRSVPLDQRIKDVKSWMSAALTYEYDCNSALKYVNTTQQVRSAMEQIDTVTSLTSNALSMVDALDTYGTNTQLWKPPQTERSDYSHGHSSRVKAYYGDYPQSLVHAPTLGELVPNLIVSKDNVSGFSSIQAAVNSAPDYSVKRFVIHIKAGVYEEIVRVPHSKTNLMFVGDGMDQTVITGSMNAQTPGVTTYQTATVGVNADGFIARDIAFENTAGPNSHQAVALRVDSDLSAFHNCALLGHQDTLYTHALRQFYKDCRIEGTLDFIFGNSAAIFHNCLILVRPRQLLSKNGENDPVTAQGRTDPAQPTGLVFQNCTIKGTEEYMRDFYANPKIHKAYLGRPWKPYSRTIFMDSYLGELIRPEGWLPWNGSFALDTLFYGEFQNYGPGAKVSGRVPWCNQIFERSVGMYSIQSFIQGDQWLLPTSVPT
eukprot:Gb_31587 [translate_table: standard]